MFQVPTFLEVNDSPTIAVFQKRDQNDPRNRMEEVTPQNFKVNGHNLDSLQEFAGISRHDSIDQIGLATSALADSAAKYSKSGLRQALIKDSQLLSKVNSHYGKKK